MISWPNWRSRMPARARSAFAAIKPKTLRCAGGVSQPSRKSGALRWKEAQRVALDDLAEVHQPAELVGGGRDVDGHDGVAGLGRGEQMADGADAADARGDAGHFAVGPAFAEFLEAAEFHDVEFGVGHVARVVHEDADLGVALDAGHGINDDAF